MGNSDEQGLSASRFEGDPVFEAIYDGERLLRVGDSGPAVVKLQETLVETGFELPRYGADGQFGTETKAAVEAFQRDAGLTGRSVDGIVGPVTLRLLDERLSDGSTPGVTPGRDRQGTLEDAYDLYRGTCDCGEVLENNCAHYLSDAFIRAGYAELDGGTGGLFRRHHGKIVCKAGRPVRARELREWFEEMATDTRDGEPSDDGYWAVFQHDPDRYWGGHVAIHKHDGEDYDWVGTGDYPGWETQEHYRW
jgi:hypothetical protein